MNLLRKQDVMQCGAMSDSAWQALCSQLEEAHAQRPAPLEILDCGFCKTKWVLVCVSEAECERWWELLRGSVRWAYTTVEKHRAEGEKLTQLRATTAF